MRGPRQSSAEPLCEGLTLISRLRVEILVPLVRCGQNPKIKDREISRITLLFSKQFQNTVVVNSLTEKHNGVLV